MPVTKFRVLIGNFSCRGLPAADSNGLSDPYIMGDFDNYRSFRTPKINKTLNPIWHDYSTQFFYETKYGRQLHLKYLKFDVYDHDMFSRDDYLGSAKIDLYTLATGPIRHELQLKDAGKDAGVIRFDVRMEEFSEVTVKWSDIRIQNIQLPASIIADKNSPINPFITMSSVNGKQQGKVKSEIFPDTKNPAWKSIPNLVFPELSLRELINDGVVIKLKCSRALKSVQIGTCTIGFQKFFCNENEVPVVVKGFFVDGSRNVVGKLKATATFQGLPAYAQMVSGENINGVCTGTPLIPNAYVPDGYKDMTPPAFNIQNSGDQAQKLKHHSITTSSIPSPLNNGGGLQRSHSMIDQGNTGPYQQSPASASMINIPILPPGWEMKYHKNGKPFYIDHNTRTTHWTPPMVNSTTNSASSNQTTSPPVESQPSNSTPQQQPVPTTNEAPLPPGWEIRYDENGRQYFANHDLMKTQWEDPRHTLPPGWEMTVDKETGRVFYLDHNTKTTHWTPPTVTTTGGPSPTLSTAPPPQVDEEKPLPPGWEMRYDKNGRRYFSNHIEKKTQWEDPRTA